MRCWKAPLICPSKRGCPWSEAQRTSSHRWAVPAAPQGPSDVPPTRAQHQPRVVGPGRGHRAVRAPGPSMPTPPELGHRGALQGAKPVTLRSAAPSEDSQGLLNGSVLRAPWNSSALQLCPVLCPLSSPISPLPEAHLSAGDAPAGHPRQAGSVFSPLPRLPAPGC